MRQRIWLCLLTIVGMCEKLVYIFILKKSIPKKKLFIQVRLPDACLGTFIVC